MKKPFVGFFTIESEKEIERENIVLVGLPIEGKKETKKGTKRFPSQIRRFSYLFSGISPSYNFNIATMRCVDLGNIHPIKNQDIVKKLWREQEKTNSKLLFIGGDHLITYYTISQALQRKNVGLIWFDAHMDLAREYPKKTYFSHATALYNLIEEKIFSPDQILIIGGHGFTHSQDEYDYWKSMQINLIKTEDIFKNVEDSVAKLDNFLSKYPRIYLSLDIDVLDQSFVPTVSCPEPFGLYPDQLIKFLSHIVPKSVYVDIVEGRITRRKISTARVICSLIFQIISFWDKSK
ncbi:MAG: arginase family protein [Candidatus Heimdallarchaeum aukensis]|uniref:Arginase family protein n=1 Tax=Candidatus Heimdallarchaeum aukensis TaxID=2876573 RepID=A0A9Y1FLN9_9ARCH|nr:MAG: arginase family protein [Candidatus Heimdallarchaeum aukensis]